MGKQLVEDLRAARALVDTPEKWGKGPLGGGYGSLLAENKLCAGVAIERACGGANGRYRECRRLFNIVGRGVPDENLVGWNDAPERTHAEVLAAFDSAIAAAEREGEDGKA